MCCPFAEQRLALPNQNRGNQRRSGPFPKWRAIWSVSLVWIVGCNDAFRALSIFVAFAGVLNNATITI